jgi:hypothetical protein
LFNRIPYQAGAVVVAGSIPLYVNRRQRSDPPEGSRCHLFQFRAGDGQAVTTVAQ